MKKKIICLFTVVTMLIGCIPLIATAVSSGTCGTNLTWTLDDEGTLTISGNGNMEDDAAYSAPWYWSRSSIVSVVIENGVASIGNYAFYNCSALTSVTISDSVTSIGNSAFEYCSGLNSVTISNNVTSIGWQAFSNCTGLTSVTIPDSVTSIDSHTFSDCSGLTSVTIPDSVTTISERAFAGCSGLTSVTIPDSVTSLGQSAFNSCSGLTSVTIGSGVTSIGDRAFCYCSGLTSVYYNAENCTSMGSYGTYDDTVFKGCTALKEIYIGDNVKSIPNYAFYGCSGLETIYYNAENCTSMGSSNYPVFEGCTALKEIYIGDNVKKIPSYAFYGTGYYNDSSNWDNGVLYIDNCLIKANSDKISDEYEINSPTRLVADSAFSGCTGLMSITIPDSVTNIGSSAFMNCDSLDSVYISDMTAYLNIDFGNATSCPMYYANKLYLNGKRVTSVEISNDVTQIPAYAFCGCDSIISVIVSDSVTNIGEYAFSSCAGLTDVYYNGTLSELVKISVGSNNGAFSNTKIHCADITADRWGTCGNNLTWTLNDGTLTISGTGDMTNYSSSSVPWYSSRSNITSVVIENGVTSIAENAFSSCANITSLNYNAQKVYDTFSSCGNLTSVVLGGSVKNIDKNAFANCTNLEEIVISKSVTEIEIGAFSGCSSLKTVEYGGSKDEWDEIYIGTNNDYLKNADIHYSSSIAPTPVPTPIPTTTAEIERTDTDADDVYSFDVNVADKYENCYVYAAVYDESGALLAVNRVPLDTAGDTSVSVNKSENDALVKVFIWADTLQPIVLANEFSPAN